MKKILCVLMALTMLLAAFALAETPDASGRVIRPMNGEVNLNEGTYPVDFDRGNLSEGTLRDVRIYTVDCYDIVDIQQMAVGDSIVVEGKDIVINSLEEDEYGNKLVNGGFEADGCTLSSYEEDNCWMCVEYNDFHTYTEQATETLTLSESVTFTDGWDIDAEPVTVSGIEAVTKAIQESENDSFYNHNTEIRLEDGKVVEIIRRFVP